MELGLVKFVEYAKLHLISLEQDASKFAKLMDEYTDDYDSDEYRDLEMEDIVNTGEMRATMHLLQVAQDILKAADPYTYTEEYFADGHSQTVPVDR